MAQERKYSHLSQNFFRGSLKGQINSVYKDRESKPEKTAEFKQAITDGEVKLTGTVTKQLANKLVTLGITIPDTLEVKQGAAAEETQAE